MEKKHIINTLTLFLILIAGYFFWPVAYYSFKEEKQMYELRKQLLGKWLLVEKGKAHVSGNRKDSIYFGLYHNFFDGEFPSGYKIETFPTSYTSNDRDIYIVVKRLPFKMIKLSNDTLTISQAFPVGNPIGPIEVYVKSNPTTLHSKINQ